MSLTSESLSTGLWLTWGWQQAWQIALLTLAIAIITRLACRRRPHLAYLLWLLVLVKALTPPLWSSPVGLFSWAQAEWAQPQPAATLVVPAGELQGSLLLSVDDATHEADQPSLTAVSSAAGVPSTPWITKHRIGLLLLAVWAAGSGTLLCIFARKRRRLVRLLRETQCEIDPALAHQFTTLARQIGPRRPARLLVTSAPLGPAAFGWWPGTVIVPQAVIQQRGLAGVTPILAHELIHLRRGDTWVGSLQLVALVAWWFHPAVWWAHRQLRLERERACDEAVVAELNCPPSEYARMLVDMLSWRQQGAIPTGWPAMRAWDVTADRLHHLLHDVPLFRRRTPLGTWVAALLVAAVVLPGAGLVLSAAPPVQETAAADEHKTQDTPKEKTKESAKESEGATEEKIYAFPLDRSDPLVLSPEQQAAIDVLKPLGFAVSVSTFNGKLQFYGRFTNEFRPIEEPLPLANLEGLKIVEISEDRVSPELFAAQLHALRQLRGETSLGIQLKPDGPPLTGLEDIPALERLMLIEIGFGTVNPASVEVPPFNIQRLGLKKLTRLKVLLCIFPMTAPLATEIYGLKTLEELSISDDQTKPVLDDAILNQLTGFNQLKRLSLYSNNRGEPLNLDCLAHFPQLERLLTTFQLTDRAMEQIGRLEHLKSLGFEAALVTDQGFSQLSSLSDLRVLNVFQNKGSSPVTSSGLKSIGKLTKLKGLLLSGGAKMPVLPVIDDEVLLAWKPLQKLRSLQLSQAKLTDLSAPVISSWTKLEILSMHGSLSFSDGSVRFSPNLRELNLSIPHWTSQGIQSLSPLVQLKSLTLLDARNIGADSFAALTGLSQLTTMKIQQAKLKGPGIAALNKLQALDNLDLSKCHFDAASLADVAALQHIDTLRLSDAGITDEILKEIGKDAQINTLLLDGNPLHDAALVTLRDMKNLKRVSLGDTETTARGRRQLAKARPGLQIEDRPIGWGVFQGTDDSLLEDDPPEETKGTSLQPLEFFVGSER